MEVQGETKETQQEFAERIYTYNYRLFDRFGKDVLSLVVLTDSDKDFRPTEYRREFLGNTLLFKFQHAKLIDIPEDVLEASPNPFALVTLIQLDYNRVRRDAQKCLARKEALTYRLYRRQFGEKRVLRLFRFLDFLMRLPEPLAIQYRAKLEAIEGELNMPYVTSVERLAKKEGLAEGLTEGRARGLTEGELRRARSDVIEVLGERLGEVPYTLQEDIKHIDDGRKLRKLLLLAATVESIDQFRV